MKTAALTPSGLAQSLQSFRMLTMRHLFNATASEPTSPPGLTARVASSNQALLRTTSTKFGSRSCREHSHLSAAHTSLLTPTVLAKRLPRLSSLLTTRPPPTRIILAVPREPPWTPMRSNLKFLAPKRPACKMSPQLQPCQLRLPHCCPRCSQSVEPPHSKCLGWLWQLLAALFLACCDEMGFTVWRLWNRVGR